MPHPSEQKTPFNAVGPELIAKGYSALPIAPGDKVPGAYMGGVWRMMRGWSKYCSSVPAAFQVQGWKTWPDAGVGVALGRGLVAVDIDLDDAVEAVVMALPETPVAKRGAKGLTLFFRGNTAKIRSRAFKTKDKIGLCDLLSDGKQSVLPPSIHPRTGNPYAWTTTHTLLDTRLEELGDLPDNAAEIIAEALRPFGYEAEPERESFEWNGQLNDSRSQATDFFRRLNEDALANLDAWVPKLNLFKAIRQGNGWRAIPHWRPSSSGLPTNRRQPNLSFNPQGIKDFGDGDKTYTPLNVVMAALDMGNDLDTAAKWLGEWIGYNFAPAIDLVAGSQAPSVKAATAEASRLANRAPEAPAGVLAASEPAPVAEAPPPRLGNIAAALAGEIAGEVEVPEQNVIPLPTGDPKLARYHRLVELTQVPGVVGDLVEWIVASGERPAPVLALGAALVAVGTVAGRFYATPTKLRTNLYIVGLAESGFGKETARACIKSLFRKNGMGRFLGGSKIMSGSGLREQVSFSPSTGYFLDEFGGFMRDINDRRSGQHTRIIRDFLLEFYSSAQSVFQGADYAAGKTPEIQNPNLGIFGVSTQFDFWNGMISGGVADGLLARMTVLTMDCPKPARRKTSADSDNAPKKIVDALHRIMETRGGNLSGATNDSATSIEPLFLKWGPGAEERHDELVEEVDRATEKTQPALRPVMNRLAENAQKMAAVVAIGVNPERPVITRELIEWGFALAWLSTESVFDEIKGRLANNPYQEQYLDVKRIIQDAGRDGVTMTKIRRQLNGKIESRKLDEIIQGLRDSKEVDLVMYQNPRGGPKSGRYTFLHGYDEETHG